MPVFKLHISDFTKWPISSKGQEIDPWVMCLALIFFFAFVLNKKNALDQLFKKFELNNFLSIIRYIFIF